MISSRDDRNILYTNIISYWRFVDPAMAFWQAFLTYHLTNMHESKSEDGDEGIEWGLINATYNVE
jgi:hypothetical protein